MKEIHKNLWNSLQLVYFKIKRYPVVRAVNVFLDPETKRGQKHHWQNIVLLFLMLLLLILLLILVDGNLATLSR